MLVATTTKANIVSETPVLYSFRRCPYAMRARLAIKYSGVQVELREIVLRNKPQAMLDISPKATVPVLQLPNGDVIDESWDIALWATALSDLAGLCGDNQQLEAAIALVHSNDHEFKPQLDRYKYADRHPEHSAAYYRQQADGFLQSLDGLLAKNNYLLGDSISLADIGIFPFIRQFAHVDLDWFRGLPHLHLIKWYEQQIKSDVFVNIMKKYPVWSQNDTVIVL